MVLSLALEDKTAARRGEDPAAPFFPPKNGRAENHRKDPARAGGARAGSLCCSGSRDLCQRSRSVSKRPGSLPGEL